jgi:hypothetical protein
MAWVKRNLIFVIIIAVGLIATGYCGYLLFSVLGANSGVKSDYDSTLTQLETAQKANPPATKENIEAAKADGERVGQLLVNFRKSFGPFPIAPKVDDRGFVEHLQLILRQFGAEATNAGVRLPPDYAFSFSQQLHHVSFSSECIGPWMQELEEIKLILRILYAAKINYLEQIQRVPACNDDLSGDDCLNATSVSNQLGVIAPYKITFTGFSTEVASVLTGFAVATNYFVVKYLNITPSRAPLPVVSTPTAPTMQQRYIPPPDYGQYTLEDGERPGRGSRGRPMSRQPVPAQAAAPAGPTPPETILQETPLYVTLVVDAVKLKMPEPAKPPDQVKPRTGERGKPKTPEQ